MRNSYKGYWFYIQPNTDRKCWELILEKKSKLELNGMHFVELKNWMTLGEIYELAHKEIDKRVEDEIKQA